MTGWRPDVLGAGWECLTLDVGHDAQGPLVATLVRRVTAGDGPPDGRAVLYVHGYNDYFFQTHVAEAAEAHGYAFFALDLRRSGRSLRPGQTPHDCADLSEYTPELDAAAAVVRGLGHRRLAVMGHSTGGLVAALWAHDRRDDDVVDALVLNSPWLQLNARWWRRAFWVPVVAVLGRVAPHHRVSGGPSAYSSRLHATHGGEWRYDLALKPPGGLPVLAGWLRAVLRGHARVARGLGVRVPVLVCTSASSGANRADNPDLARQETVLEVRHTWRRAPLLGADVTVVPIEGGIHDLSLSAEPARSQYLRTVLEWLDLRM